MKKQLLSALLLLSLSSPVVFAEDAPVTPPAATETKAEEVAPAQAAPVQVEPAKKVDDPRDAIKEKRAAHQSYMQEQRQKMREVKTDEERRVLIEAQREYMQEYMEEMHELMRAAQAAEGRPDESGDDMMPPPPYYGYGPRTGGASPYARMPRMPYGYGPRGWDNDMPSRDEAGPPCQAGSKRRQNYEEMQQRLDRIEKLLENLQAK